MIIYFLLAIPLLMSVVFLGAMLYATAYDWWYYRKYKSFILLQQDHTKPKRPAAK